MKQLKDIKRICNLGCGTMGFGTAIAFAQNGYEVNMFGRKDASIARAMRNIHATLDVMKANDLLTEVEEKNYSVISMVLHLSKMLLRMPILSSNR